MSSLNIENLEIKFETVDGIIHALNGVNIFIEKGSTLGLVGETGAGKTTTALSIMGLVQQPPANITKGKITLGDIEILKDEKNKPKYISEKELEKIRGNKVSMIFQDPMTSLTPVLTVEEQIAEVIEIHEKLPKKQAILKAKEMLELVGIEGHRGSEYPHQFSGGMKQRVVIAMALSCNPEFLIADEPTTALDVTIQAQVLELMKQLKEKKNTSMLMITHDLGIVAEICDYVSIMYAGKIIEYGKIEEIFNNTKHPYTEGLFSSIPNIENRKAMLEPIQGITPDPSCLPKGCTFHPRCKYCMDICKEVEPKKIQGDNHYVLCHLYDESNKLQEKVIKR